MNIKDQMKKEDFITTDINRLAEESYMNQKDLITKELQGFMIRFEQDNRGGKISLEFIQGLGMTLNMLITDIVQQILDQQDAVTNEKVKSPNDITKEKVIT